jgi:curved DNA-binding protein CbpA
MDPFVTLGVSKDCTREEAKEAFRAGVRRHHPDRGGGDHAFIRFRAAYEQVLAEIDRRGVAETTPEPPAPSPQDPGHPPPPDPKLVAEYFAAVVRHGSRSRRRGRRGGRLNARRDSVLWMTFDFLIIANILYWGAVKIGLNPMMALPSPIREVVFWLFSW